MYKKLDKNFNRNTKVYKLILCMFFLICFFNIFSISYGLNISDISNFSNDEYLKKVSNNNIENSNLEDEEILEKYIFLTYNEKLDKEIYKKNENEKFNPASITKVVTAILAIENLDLNSKITITKDMLNIPSGYVSVPLIEGEKVSVLTLLEYALIPSCNDASLALEIALNSSQKPYLDLASNLFKKLNMNDSNFTNSYGYADPNHYTTASDLLKLSKYVIQNETFLNIISKNQVNSPIYLTRPYSIKESTNKFLVNGPYNREDVFGLKTGFNELGGYCFISVNKNPDGNKTINILGKLDRENQRYLYSNILFNNSLKIETAEIKEKERVELEHKKYIEEMERLKREKINEYKEKIKVFLVSIFLIYILYKFLKPNKNKNKNKNRNNNNNKNRNRNRNRKRSKSKNRKQE